MALIRATSGSGGGGQSGDECAFFEFTATAASTTIDCGIENPDVVTMGALTSGIDWSLFCWTSNKVQYSAWGANVPRSASRRNSWTPTINGTSITVATAANSKYMLVVAKKNS